MRASYALSALFTLALAGSAQAGAPVPGPEIGEGYAGLAVVGILAASYFVFRHLRARKG